MNILLNDVETKLKEIFLVCIRNL